MLHGAGQKIKVAPFLWTME